ncbi:glycosyltransferase family 39 protein [Cohnella sp. 56]|uniref:glycosyltransferase family 39 protein n=1 Tax=Cohnella sp. 56 TaxID=3113722 RepID=UPI0030E891D6
MGRRHGGWREDAPYERTGANGRLWAWLAVSMSGVCAFVFALLHLSPWAAGWDEVDFVLALDRYDLLAMQPHAPGYPYFILGGRLMALWPGIDGPRALALWNLLLTASSAYPLYRLARRWLGSWSAALAAALVLTLPMNAALAVRAMSEGAALALLWWYLWAAVCAAERPTTGRFLGAAWLFGLLMGTRLSYAPFGLALGWVWLAALAAGPGVEAEGRRAPGFGARAARGLLWLAGAASCQLLWLGGMAAAEGGVGSMVALLRSFAQGHFDRWGGGAIADPMPLSQRLLLFAGDNMLWTGSFAQRYILLGAAAWLLGCAIVAAGSAGTEPMRRVAPDERAANRTPGQIGAPAAVRPAVRGWPARMRALAGFCRRPRPAALLVASGAAYALWALLGQNIARPRHAAPLAALLLLGLAVTALRRRGQPRLPLASRAALAGALLLLAAQSAEAARLVSLQASQRPAVYRLADYAAAHMQAPAVLYTWEEERVLNYLHPDIQARPIYTYAYFLADLRAAPDARIWLTGAVLEGFRRQGAPVEHARLLAQFRSDARLDPVYGTISLYEWVR